ncbi:hypothetical protein NE237_032468 [Protea cynaroides]|uniref:Tyrosine decarboxylase n=1 Tax=Protea cynaroides TaxID=273540 RepID=A0A9Q0L425_9MAGN|nr:hypothetical protein NE237_032468 [Protea cynaroides]
MGPADGFRNNSDFTLNPLDPQEFRRQKYPVRSQVDAGYLHKLLPDSAPNHPEPIQTILQDVHAHIIPGITHWQSPNYFAYFPSSGSVVGFLGEMLSTGSNVVGFNWLSSPAVTELETIVMDWLGKMLKLPNSFLFFDNGGDQMLNKIGREHIGKLVVYGPDQTHCIHPNNFLPVSTSRSTAFGLSPDSLCSAILADLKTGLVPLFLCATIGTTSSTVVDPVGSLCDVAKEFGIWVYVDAAYAESACICLEFRHYIDNVENADSFSLNAHKWFFTTLDCYCLWAKYLRNKATETNTVIDYKDWQIALIRAMKLWLVRSYGVTNLRNFLKTHVKMAKHFEGLVTKDKRFEIVVPMTFAMVCFRLLPSTVTVHANGEANSLDEKHANELNRKFLESMNSPDRVYMHDSCCGGGCLHDPIRSGCNPNGGKTSDRSLGGGTRAC